MSIAVDEPKISAIPKRTLPWSLVACSFFIALAYLPLLLTHARQLWQRPHYQFFPFVIVGAAVLAWSRAAGLRTLTPGGSTLSMSLAAGCWLLLAVSEVLHSSWLAAVGMLFLVLSVLYSVGGGPLLRRMLPVWLYLWLLVPPPFGLDHALILNLQTLTTRWSSSLLDLVGIYHGVAGHVMEIGGQRLFVEEACAGVNSLFSILACALFYVLYTRVPVLRAVVLLLASIGWVLLANVARVFLVAYVLKRYSINLAEGWRHDALGFVLFAVALGLIWSTNRLILFLTPFLNKQAQAAASQGPSAPGETEKPNWAAALHASWVNSWLTAAAFGLIAALHFGSYGMDTVFAAGPGQVVQAVHDLNEDTLPRDMNGWKREKMTEETRSESNAFGQYSKTWHYRGPLANAAISLDYPFAEWHDLTECYYGQGWVLEASDERSSGDAKGPAHYCEHQFKKAGGRHGYLLFCQFDSTGRILSPIAAGGVRATARRQEMTIKRFLSWGESADEWIKPVGSVYQCQLFTESFTPQSDQDRAKAKERFFQAFQELHRPFQVDSKNALSRR